MSFGEWSLNVFAILYMAAPLGFAAYVEYHTRAFQQIAFGRFKQVALYLRITAWVVYLYYVMVMAFGYATGTLGHMMEWPLSTDALWTYVRLSVALLSYVFFSMVARELYMITRPEPGGKSGRI